MFDSTRVLDIVNTHYRTLQDLQRVHRELDRRFAGLEDATLAVILSAASGEPLLLIGPPGTAKSMLIKTFCDLVGVDREGSSSRYFEYLLTPFTEPGELFGFYDPSKLTKDGTLERIHADSMMQSAHVVFLDEVFKGSSAILNALLSFMNECRCSACSLRPTSSPTPRSCRRSGIGSRCAAGSTTSPRIAAA